MLALEAPTVKRHLSLLVGLFALAASSLALAQDTPKFPAVKIMIVVPEFHHGKFALLEESMMSRATWLVDGYTPGSPACETQLIKQFVDANYKVVDQSQYAALRYSPAMEAALKDPASPQARSLTANTGADILIVGKLTSEAADKVQNTNSVRASLTIRAVCTTGEALVVGAMDTTGSGADISADAASLVASRKAADLAAAYLLQKVGNLVGGPTTNDALSALAEKAAASGRPRIAVMPFEDQSQWAMADWNLGTQIPDLIANELMKIGRYEVLDRANLNQTIQQQGLQQGGLFDSEGKAEELGTLAKADYGVYGRISEFATKKKGGLLALPGLGAALGSEESKVNILLKIVDLKTGVVLATNEAHGDATAAVIGGGYVGIVFGGAQFDKSAAGRATRKAIAAATKAVVDALPAVCPKCGGKITGNDKFCPDCGTDLTAASPTKCAKCGEALKPGDKFCRKCGKKVGE